MTTEELFQKIGIDKNSYKDLHIIRLFSSFVAISDGKVIKVTDPSMTYCPLARQLYRHIPIPDPPDRETIKMLIRQGIEEKIEKLGFYTAQRKLEYGKIAIPYGASEILMYALKKRAIDAAIVACEGAGSVIATSPDVVQGIGARMNGLFYTTPIPEIIERLERLGSHVPFKDGTISQQEAVREAARSGLKNVAVTVNGHMDERLDTFREIEAKHNINIAIFLVCSTGVSLKRAEEIRDRADVVWSCASEEVRQIVGPKSILQITRKIPVFVLTKNGLDAVSAYSNDMELVQNLDPKKQHFIAGDCRGKKISMGKFQTYLSEAELPVRSDDEPRFRALLS
jgi:putative methanogenesis marker protein 8